MNKERGRLFDELTPPPGGLQALRNRLDEEPARRRRRVRRSAYFTTCAAAVGLVVLMMVWSPLTTMNGGGVPPLRIDAELNPALIRLGVAEATGEPVSVPREQRLRMAVERVDVDSPRVVFYRVEVIEDPELPAT